MKRLADSHPTPYPTALTSFFGFPLPQDPALHFHVLAPHDAEQLVLVASSTSSPRVRCYQMRRVYAAFECLQEWQCDIPLAPTKHDTFQYRFAIRDVEQTASRGLDGSEGAWAPPVPLLTEGTAPAIVEEYTSFDAEEEQHRNLQGVVGPHLYCGIAKFRRTKAERIEEGSVPVKETRKEIRKRQQEEKKRKQEEDRQGKAKDDQPATMHSAHRQAAETPTDTPAAEKLIADAQATRTHAAATNAAATHAADTHAADTHAAGPKAADSQPTSTQAGHAAGAGIRLIGTHVADTQAADFPATSAEAADTHAAHTRGAGAQGAHIQTADTQAGQARGTPAVDAQATGTEVIDALPIDTPPAGESSSDTDTADEGAEVMETNDGVTHDPKTRCTDTGADDKAPGILPLCDPEGRAHQVPAATDPSGLLPVDAGNGDTPVTSPESSGPQSVKHADVAANCSLGQWHAQFSAYSVALRAAERKGTAQRRRPAGPKKRGATLPGHVALAFLRNVLQQTREPEPLAGLEDALRAVDSLAAQWPLLTLGPLALDETWTVPQGLVVLYALGVAGVRSQGWRESAPKSPSQGMPSAAFRTLPPPLFYKGCVWGGGGRIQASRGAGALRSAGRRVFGGLFWTLMAIGLPRPQNTSWEGMQTAVWLTDTPAGVDGFKRSVGAALLQFWATHCENKYERNGPGVQQVNEWLFRAACVNEWKCRIGESFRLGKALGFLGVATFPPSKLSSDEVCPSPCCTSETKTMCPRCLWQPVDKRLLVLSLSSSRSEYRRSSTAMGVDAQVMISL